MKRQPYAIAQKTQSCCIRKKRRKHVYAYRALQPMRGDHIESTESIIHAKYFGIAAAV